MRYAGQGYELNVPWTADFVEQFHKLHQQRYGYADRARPVQVVNARVRMVAATEPIEPRKETARSGDGKQAIIDDHVYERSRLHPGDCFAGPASVVEYSATTYVPQGARVSVDELANLVIEL
jgi:N-methylhydantoinase A